MCQTVRLKRFGANDDSIVLARCFLENWIRNRPQAEQVGKDLKSVGEVNYRLNAER